MPTLPHAGFFDRIEPLNPNQDNGLDWSESPFANTTSLSGSLPSFLIWQDEFAYAWAVKKNIHFILAHYNKYVYMPVPPQPVTEESLAWAFGYMASVNGPGPGISRIEGVTHLGLKKPPVGPYQPRPILTEYIYDRSHVASLQGNDFRSQRALLNHLLREEKVLFRPYRSSDLKACCELFELWKGQRLPALQGQMGEKMILSAQKAHLRALLQGERVGMSSWVVFVGERLAAYTSGAPSTPKLTGSPRGGGPFRQGPFRLCFYHPLPPVGGIPHREHRGRRGPAPFGGIEGTLASHQEACLIRAGPPIKMKTKPGFW